MITGQALYKSNFFELPSTTQSRRTALKEAIKNRESVNNIWLALSKKPKNLGLIDLDDVVQLINTNYQQNQNEEFWRTASALMEAVLQNYTPEQRIKKSEQLAKDLDLNSKFAKMVEEKAGFNPPVAATQEGIYRAVYLKNPIEFANFVNQLETSSIVAFLQKQFWMDGEHCFRLLPVLAEKFNSEELQNILKKEFPRKGSILSKAARYIETSCLSKEEKPEIMEVLSHDKLRGMLDLPANVVLKVVEKYNADPGFCSSMASRPDFSQKLGKFLNSNTVTKEHDTLVKSQPYLSKSWEVYRASKNTDRAQAIKTKLEDKNVSQALYALVAANQNDFQKLIPVQKKPWYSFIVDIFSIFRRPNPVAIAAQDKLEQQRKLELAQKSPYFASQLYNKTLLQLALEDEKPVPGLETVYEKGLSSADGFVLLLDTLKKATADEVVAFIKKYLTPAEEKEVKQDAAQIAKDRVHQRLVDEFVLREALTNKILSLDEQRLVEIKPFLVAFVEAALRLGEDRSQKILTAEVRAKLQAYGSRIQQLLAPKEPAVKEAFTQTQREVVDKSTGIEVKMAEIAVQTNSVIQRTTEVQVEIKNETREMATQVGVVQQTRDMQTEITGRDWATTIDMRNVSIEEAVKFYVANYDADAAVKMWLEKTERTQRAEQLTKIDKHYIDKFITSLQKKLVEPQQVVNFIVENFAAVGDPNTLERLDHLIVNIILGSSNQLVSSLLKRIAELEQQLAASKQLQAEGLESKTSQSSTAVLELNKLRAVMAACYLRVRAETIPSELKGLWLQIGEVGFKHITQIFNEMPVEQRSQILSSWKNKNVRVVEELMAKFPILTTPWINEDKLVEYLISVKPSSSFDELNSNEVKLEQDNTREGILEYLQPLFQSKTLRNTIVNKLQVILNENPEEFINAVLNLFDDGNEFEDHLNDLLLDAAVPQVVDKVPTILTVLPSFLEEGSLENKQILESFFKKCYSKARVNRVIQAKESKESADWKILDMFYRTKLRINKETAEAQSAWNEKVKPAKRASMLFQEISAQLPGSMEEKTLSQAQTDPSQSGAASITGQTTVESQRQDEVDSQFSGVPSQTHDDDEVASQEHGDDVASQTHDDTTETEIRTSLGVSSQRHSDGIASQTHDSDEVASQTCQSPTVSKDSGSPNGGRLSSLDPNKLQASPRFSILPQVSSPRPYDHRASMLLCDSPLNSSGKKKGACLPTIPTSDQENRVGHLKMPMQRR